jgi:hypothetical protein
VTGSLLLLKSGFRLTFTLRPSAFRWPWSSLHHICRSLFIIFSRYSTNPETESLRRGTLDQESKVLSLLIEDFGARVASVWAGLRSTTRHLVEHALQSNGASAAATTTVVQTPARVNLPYDARADVELSRLLAALDERAADSAVTLSAEQSDQLKLMAETCAAVLQNQTQSAEVFAQLVQRAHARHDFARIDALADVLATHFAPAETCELARNGNTVARALAQEALAQLPTHTLMMLLADPIDSDIARDALERQAHEYGSDEARRIVSMLYQADALDEEM